MKPIRILRHVNCGVEGYLCHYLAAHGIAYENVCLGDGAQALDDDVEACAGIAVMGAPVSVNDPLPWVRRELALVEKAIARDVPVLGICFGGQILSKALGAEVKRGHGMEIGWHPVERVEGCRAPWLAPLPERMWTFHWHADTFAVPGGATPLLRSRCFRNQAFEIGPHLGMQFHLEVTPGVIDEWIALYGSDLDGGHPCRQSAAQIRADLMPRVRALHRVADVFYGEWLRRTGLAPGGVQNANVRSATKGM